MKFTAALLTGFVAATTAFLVPPEIPEDFRDLRFKGGPPEHVKDFIHALLEGRTTTIDLECPGCPFAKDGDENSVVWDGEGVDSRIHLEFATSGRILTLNGHPLLPFEEAQRARSTTIKAHQIREGQKSADVSLNFAMEVMPPMPSPHKDDVSLIPVEFTILGLNGVPVKVNTISLELLQTPTKELVLVKHKEIPFQETPGAEICDGARVWSICRLRAIVMARMKSIVEATRQKTGNVQGWVKTKCGGRRKAHEHQHQHPHHKHHGPHRYHRVSHMLHQTFRFFIIPALLGVIGGLAASAIGMLVGQAIVLVVRSHRRGRRPLHVAELHRQGMGPIQVIERGVVFVPEEKQELLAEDGLPEYEDAPKYEAIVQEKIEPDSSSENEKQ